MTKGFAIHNAPTDHGGVVPATQMRSSQMGNLFVCAGDGHFCPKCKCWSTVIKSHDHVIFSGKAVAYVGDQLTCGARIQPQQSHVVGDSGSYNNRTQSTPKINNAINDDNQKKIIKEIYWSYGENFTRLESESRHFVDMHLHIKTANYSPGEMVEVTIKYSDGDFIFDSLRELKIKESVNSQGEAVIKNIFKNKTLNLK